VEQLEAQLQDMQQLKSIMRKSFFPLVSLLVFMGKNSFSQYVPHLTVTGNKYQIDYKKHIGTLYLKSGETIKGIFEYASFEFPTFNFKYYSNDGKFIKRYKVSVIDSLIVSGADSSLTNADSTCFIKIGKNGLYRQLTNGSLKIYDQLVNVNEREGLIYSTIYVFDNNMQLKFLTENSFIKYIEAKLKERGIQKTFKSIREAVHYINYSNI
jgi:hypothetical protein